MSRFFCFYYEPGFFWFRIFGYGLSCADKVLNPPLFSERYGYRRVLRVGRWGFEFLRPRKR
jgi:hypothetical protein